MRFNRILLCIDNSDLSQKTSEAALHLAKAFASEVVGIHGYNASMHEGAFRTMEPVLPAQYQREEILEKQRDVHNTLIHAGMEKISLSYLKPIAEMFHGADIPFRARVREGKNFRVVNQVISEEKGDVIVMGASGFSPDNHGFIGSVCLRVLRENDQNVLIIKKHLNLHHPTFVVGLDGSSSAIDALRMATVLAGRYGASLHLLSIFDGRLHKEIFARLKESLINQEGQEGPSFDSKEQEKFHDEFIDQGLAKVGHRILDKAERDVIGSPAPGVPGAEVHAGSIPRIKKVLEGSVYRKLCEYAAEVNADLLWVGRTGRHFVKGMDLGSVTENVVRFAPCSVFVTRSAEYKGWEL